MKRLLLLCVVAAVPFLPGCGDDDEATSGDRPSSSTTAASSTTTSTPPKLDESALISPDGLGPLKIGMSLPEAKAVVGEDAAYARGTAGQTDEGCGFLTLPVKDATATFFHRAADNKPIPDVLVDIHSSNPATKTDKGIHTGSTYAEFKQAHPEIKIEAGRYSYVARWPKGPKGELRADWDTDAQQAKTLPDQAKIIGLSIRRLEQLDFDELCS
jgi:hypothetical protein